MTSPPVQINVRLNAAMGATLRREAAARGLSVTMLATQLLEAAFTARFGQSGDRALDATVAGALILSGADLEVAAIATALGVSPDLVIRILEAWDRQAADRVRFASAA